MRQFLLLALGALFGALLSEGFLLRPSPAVHNFFLKRGLTDYAVSCVDDVCTVLEAHKKGTSVAKNGRDSNAQYRGAKKGPGQWVMPGQIIFKQCGNKWYAGEGACEGKQRTIHAVRPGYVEYHQKKRTIHIVDEPSQISHFMNRRPIHQLSNIWAGTLLKKKKAAISHIPFGLRDYH